MNTSVFNDFLEKEKLRSKIDYDPCKIVVDKPITSKFNDFYFLKQTIIYTVCNCFLKHTNKTKNEKSLFSNASKLSLFSFLFSLKILLSVNNVFHYKH